MRRFLAALAAVTLLLAGALWASGHAGQTTSFTPEQRAQIVDIVRAALKSDPSILRDAIAALQADDALKQDAAARAAIGKLGPELTKQPGDPVAGNPNGDVTLVEFYDLRCPYCRRMLPVLAELLKHDPGVRLVYKDIPILGPGSTIGAKAVLAARRQGGYLKLHDALMAGSANITEETVHAAATKLGLDWERLQKDMQDPAIQGRISANLALAQTLGIQGTPAYVIGGRLMPGAVSLAQLQEAVSTARTTQ